MKMTYDKTTGVANDIVLKDLSCFFRDAIGRVFQYLDLRLIGYNRNSLEPIPDDIFDDAHDYITKVTTEFCSHLGYYVRRGYINLIDAKKTYKEFYEIVAILEDIYLYKTIYRKSSFHHCDIDISYDEEYKGQTFSRPS